MPGALRGLALGFVLLRAWGLNVRPPLQGRPMVSAQQLLGAGRPYNFDDVLRDAAGVALAGPPDPRFITGAANLTAPDAHYFKESDCTGGLFVSEQACAAMRRKPVYLASYPCSGNTWTRALLQGALQIFSGSVYNDTALKQVGFLGEGSANSRHVFPIRTHWPVTGGHDEDRGLKHLVIIREPLHAALSWCNLEHRSNDNQELPREEIAEIFDKSIELNLHEWAGMAYTFMRRPDVHVVRYEDIVRNATHAYLNSILPYLDVNISYPGLRERLESTIERSDRAYKSTRRAHNYSFTFTYQHIEMAREIIGRDLAAHYGYCFPGDSVQCDAAILADEGFSPSPKAKKKIVENETLVK